MRIALVGAEIEENLGLRYLAAALRRARHEAVVVPFDHGGEIAHVGRFVAQGGFDLVGLGMMFQLRGREFCALAERIRAEGWRGPIVGGGQWATFMAREILTANQAIDAIVLGEGEAAIVEIADAIADASSRPAALGRVRGLVLRTDDGAIVATEPRTERPALESLAPPVRDVPRRHLGIPAAQLVSGRGCYADCSFCSINAWERLGGGARFRQRAPADVAEEIAALYHERGVRIFNFHDDNFWLPTAKASRARIDALGRELAQRRVRDVALLLKCRPNDVDRDLFVACKELGLVRVFVGVETDAPSGLATLRRGVSQAQNQRALDILEALDLHVCSNLLLFDPDTRLDDVPLNIGFYERNAHHTLNFSRVEAYGGTPLTARLAREGRLSGDYLGFDYAMADPRVELLWRICHLAFHERNFPAEGLSNSVIGLGYRLRLAKRFWPSPEIERIGDLAIDFIVRFGRSQARHLRTAHELVSSCDPTDRDFATMFAIDLSHVIREEDARLGSECDALIAAIESYAEVRGAGGSPRHLGEGPAGSGWLHSGRLAVGLALASASCGTCQPSTLPPPPVPPSADGGSAVGPQTTQPGLVDADGRAGTVIAHVALSPGRRTGFGPGTESGRYETLTGDATVTGPGSESYELQAVTVEPAIARVTDPFIASTGRAEHFTIEAVPEHARDAAAVVRATFRHTGGGPSLSATATFRTYEGGKLSIGLPVVPATPPYVVCDPAPAPQLTPVNTDRTVHIGAPQNRWGDQPASPITGQYATVEVTAWLDDSVQGDLATPPAVTLDGAQVTVDGPARRWSGGEEIPRSVTMTVDPRGANGRLAAGTHTLTVRFTVIGAGGRPHPFSASVPVRIDDSGLIVIGEAAAPPQLPLRWPGLPLERRFAARIVAEPEDEGILLAVHADARDPEAAYLWRASDGELVASASSPRAVWTPPARPGRHVVTCAVQTDEPGLAIATYVYEVEG